MEPDQYSYGQSDPKVNEGLRKFVTLIRNPKNTVWVPCPDNQSDLGLSVLDIIIRGQNIYRKAKPTALPQNIKIPST